MPSSNDSLGQPEDHAADSSPIQHPASNIQNPAEGSSYGQILRSSSIIHSQLDIPGETTTFFPCSRDLDLILLLK